VSDERGLSGDVTLRQPPDLSLSDHVHRFDSLKCSPLGVKGSEALTCSDPPLYGSMLFRYRTGRHRQRRPSSPDRFNSETAFGYDGFLSTLMTLGPGWPGERDAFCRKRLAAAASRLALRRKSIVAPVESTARYK
jgi:hypothetical protein